MNEENQGASFGPGSRPTDQAPSGLGATRVDPSREPRLGGGISPVQWLRSIAGADRKIRANARADEGEAIADWIEVILAERAAYRTQAVNRGWNWRLSDAYGQAEYQRHLERHVDATTDIMIGRRTFEETLRDSSLYSRSRAASAMSAFGQDPKGLEAKPASAVPSEETGDAQPSQQNPIEGD